MHLAILHPEQKGSSSGQDYDDEDPSESSFAQVGCLQAQACAISIWYVYAGKTPLVSRLFASPLLP